MTDDEILVLMKELEKEMSDLRSIMKGTPEGLQYQQLLAEYWELFDQFSEK